MRWSAELSRRCGASSAARAAQYSNARSLRCATWRPPSVADLAFQTISRASDPTIPRALQRARLGDPATSATRELRPTARAFFATPRRRPRHLRAVRLRPSVRIFSPPPTNRRGSGPDLPTAHRKPQFSARDGARWSCGSASIAAWFASAVLPWPCPIRGRSRAPKNGLSVPNSTRSAPTSTGQLTPVHDRRCAKSCASVSWLVLSLNRRCSRCHAAVEPPARWARGAVMRAQDGRFSGRSNTPERMSRYTSIVSRSKPSAEQCLPGPANARSLRRMRMHEDFASGLARPRATTVFSADRRGPCRGRARR